ncbi:MAG: hypothetical protein HKN05_13000 [Rhizobiales bacterium]|nr:hypothetical protein [Hyphomicrobiales bacterium]
MSTVFYDRNVDDNARRRDLYDGQIYVYSPTPATLALCEVAREMSEEAFAPHHPVDAQHNMSVEQYTEVLKKLKPAFIHDPRCKELIREILAEAKCDLQRTFFDVPRLRTATSNDYLTSGLAYAFKPHRDTWYSPPQCQLNWWLPVYEIQSENCMAFHTQYWDQPLKNSSNEFNYQDWNNTGRKAAHNQGKKDTRRQSEALEPVQLDPQLRIVPEPGGLIIFSAAHLHSTVPNTSGKTRISIDFRTVHLDELANNSGAPNLDSACRGTTIGDYLRGTDFSHVPENLRKAYENLENSSSIPDLVMA